MGAKFEYKLREAQRSNGQLTAELAARDRELARVHAELKRARQDLDQFTFSVSHALREPLRNLATSAELLKRKPALAADLETRESLTTVLESARRMEMLFHDLLAFIQTAGNPSGHDTDANVVLQDVLADLDDTMRRTNATVTAERLPRIPMSEAHLFRVLRNLVENAIKYRSPGLPPRIHIGSQNVDDDTIICVRDNGMGIALQNQGRVFDLFKRLHGSDEYQGTGLGLAMCQKIVEQYGGRIWVESEPGNGAIFCFQVHRALEPATSLAASTG